MENTINLWAEAVASLPDQQFSNLMRLYLGEIKTPYNKQRLASQLASFIKNPQTTQTIISLLDASDLELLSAISLIPSMTQENLTALFSDNCRISDLYSKISNLKERLLIYTVKNDMDQDIFLINPILISAINPFLSMEKLLPVPQKAASSMDDVFILSPSFMACFLSFIYNHNLNLKADGNLKKNDFSKLEEIFPGKSDCIQRLITAFINLSILKEGTNGLELDDSKLKNFAKLTQLYQYALLTAAACSRFSRDGLKKEAQLLIDTISSIPQTGYTRKNLLRLAFILGTKTEDGSAVAKKSRFTQLLEAAKANNNQLAAQNLNVLGCMLESAESFGLIQKTGTTEAGEKIFVPGELPPEYYPSPVQAAPKALNIESTFQASLMPGLNLSQLLPLSQLLNVQNYGIVCQFELTKQSVCGSFDKGQKAEDVFNILEQFTPYELPQNLKINITEWYNSYSSAQVFCGYVLKVTENNISLVKNNPKIQKYIQEILAPGVFLLNLPLDQSPVKILAECGIDFMGTVKTPAAVQQTLDFPLLRPGKKMSAISPAEKSISSEALPAHFSALRKKLETLDLDRHQKESLNSRILNRLILSENQLSSAAVRTEILEASGMDYSGKVHLLDAAIKNNDLLELQLPSPDGNSGYVLVIGKAVSMVKNPSDTIISFETEPFKELQQIYVSRITHLRIIKY